jgi:acyl carrier protein
MNTLPASKDQTGRRGLAADGRALVLKSCQSHARRQIKNTDALLESGIIDSQRVLEVVAFIERDFSIVVEDEELSPDRFSHP